MKRLLLSIWEEEVQEVLEIKNLQACYGSTIVIDDIHINVKEGEIVCLLGRNGAGKTTLLKSIMGLVSTPRGEIYFNNENIIKKPTFYRAQLGIGYVPQGRDIFPQLTVYENLLLGLEINKGKGKIEDKVFDLFPFLKKMLKKKGGDLSGGQQQQLAIARALVSNPKLLILDEPTEGIQPSIIYEIGDVIRQLKKEGKISILIVEQYLDFVMDVSNYYYIIEKGKIVLEGSIENIDRESVIKSLAI